MNELTVRDACALEARFEWAKASQCWARLAVQRRRGAGMFWNQARWCAAAAVVCWNTQHPEGTPIRFWSGTREGAGVESRTTSVAWLLCGTPCVMVEGHSGGVALTHVEVIAVQQEVAHV